MANTLSLPYNGWKPRSYQLSAWDAFTNPASEARTIVLAWHRRAGKDELAMHGTLINAMARPANYYHCLPLYSQARKAIWESVNPRTGRIRWKEVFPDEVIAHQDNQTMSLRLKNGSTWSLIGSDNTDSLMSANPAGVVFSEAALGSPLAYGFFRPILLENKGWSLHVSSVRGKNHFWDVFRNANRTYKQDTEAGLRPRAFASHLSANDTPVYTPEELAEERQLYIDLYGESIGKSLFKQEYLSDWDAATVGAVWGTELDDMLQEGRIVRAPYDPRYPVNTAWDLGINDPTVILFFQSIGNMDYMIDWYSHTDRGLEHYAKVMADRKYLYHVNALPHDSNRREFGTGLTIMQQAEPLGLDVTPIPRMPKRVSIAAGSRLLKRLVINANPEAPPEDVQQDCTYVWEKLKAYRFKYNQETRVMSSDPVHDGSSHYADALATWALYKGGHAGFGSPIQQLQNTPEQFNHQRLRDILSQGQPRSGGVWG